MPPRTIDNLGVENYNRYAEDQALFDRSLITDSAKVFPQAAVDIAMPSFRTQFRLLMGMTALHPQWAAFAAPEMFEGARKNIFTTQLLPFMGSEDKKTDQKERIKKRRKQEREKHRGARSWHGEQEERDEESEEQALLMLFTCIERLNADMIEALAKMKQFQKG